MKKKMLFVLIASIAILFGAIVCASEDVKSGERILVKYLKTSDGDTARVVLNGENVRVRFLGINTPEVSGEDKVEEPFGNEALAYTREKLENAHKIEIEYDDVADHEDRFGRQLAWIWVDDQLFELELLEQGLAKTYMLKNNYKYATELKEAEKMAKKNQIGVWSSTNETVPNDIQKEKTIPQEKMTNSWNQNEYSKDVQEYKAEESSEISMVSVVIAILIILGIVLFTKKGKKK